jgi:hypothetical protein
VASNGGAARIVRLTEVETLWPPRPRTVATNSSVDVVVSHGARIVRELGYGPGMTTDELPSVRVTFAIPQSSAAANVTGISAPEPNVVCAVGEETEIVGRQPRTGSALESTAPPLTVAESNR